MKNQETTMEKNKMDMLLTPQWFDDQGACSDGKEWVLGIVGEGMTLRDLLPKFDRGDWMLWTLRHAETLTKFQYVELAVICAKPVLHIFEKKYPQDDRPRRAIEAAVEYAKNPTEANREIADAAANAANAAEAPPTPPPPPPPPTPPPTPT